MSPLSQQDVQHKALNTLYVHCVFVALGAAGGEDTTISLEAQRALYHLEGGGEPSPKVSPKGECGGHTP
jgi:hypothetical protein